MPGLSNIGNGQIPGSEKNLEIKSIPEIIQLLKKGELVEHSFSNIELKREWKKDVGHEVSALGNKLAHDVFWILIGVEDNGSLSGKNERWAIQTEQTISQHLNSYLDPIQASQGINCHEINGNYFLILAIGNAGSVVKWEHVAYKASGTTLSQMTPEEEMELTIQLPGLSDFSSQPWDGYINKEVAGFFVQSLLDNRKEFAYDDKEKEDPTKILDRLKISKTNVANILFGDYKYRVVFYDQQGEVLKNDTRSGLFSVLTKDFISEIQNFCSSSEDDKFPERAFKEAIANAVAHAAYFEKYGDLIVEVYHNKVCINNLCLPESSYFANKWFSRSHRTVNNLLMETLRTCGVVDELGRGKNLIFTDSLLKGKYAPEVVIEKAGRFNRWKMYIYGGKKDDIQVRLLDRLREIYKNDHKALIANALVLWRNKTVTEIKKYIDGESAPFFAEVLHDLRGPIFYYADGDRITVRRWAKVLLMEGKDSMRLTQAEEEDLKKLAFELHSKYHNHLITPSELRGLAAMTHTKSEVTLSSNLLKKWSQEGVVERVKKGTYKFKPRPKKPFAGLSFEHLLGILKNTADETAAGGADSEKL